MTTNRHSIFNAYMIFDACFTMDKRGITDANRNDSVYRAPAPLPRHLADRPASNTNPSSRRSQAVLEPLQAVLERGSTPLSPPPGGLEARQGGVRIKAYLTDFNRKIDDLKTSLKNSIRILNEITLDLVEKALVGRVTDEPQNTTISYTCDVCCQTCTSKAGLTLHKKRCQR